MSPELIENEMSYPVLGNLSTAVLMLNNRLQVVYANHAAENLLQDSFTHMQGQCLENIVSNAGDLNATLRSALQQNQLYTRRQMTLELAAREAVTVDITVTPIQESQQLLIELTPMDRYLRIDRDAAIKEHHEATRQMVRGLAHEIKNPLGGIKGSAQLLSKELDNAKGDFDEYIDIIIGEADRLTALVDRMLGPNAISEPTSVNIHEVLERVRRLIQLEASEALMISRDYDPSLPELQADPELLLQATLNVVRNAMQSLESTPHPCIHIRTRVERQFTINGQRHKMALRIEINDNGPGIRDDIREHLFYPMISGRSDGTGLGLPFAQAIIRQHGGLIEFTSEPGNTTFLLFIPLEQPS